MLQTHFIFGLYVHHLMPYKFHKVLPEVATAQAMIM